MTTFTPIRRHRQMYGCNPGCKSGAHCECSDLANSGVTLAQDEAARQQNETALFLAEAETMQRRAEPMAWTILVALVAAVVAVLW